MKYLCNPVSVPYRYQFHANPQKGGEMQICREAADPSMIVYKGRYYCFASMTLGVWVSDDLVHWEHHPLPEHLPLYDYAPDVRLIGDWVIVCASRREENCDYFRTKDILNGPYERIEGTFPFWDPNLFQDEDGRVYFYWGCSNMTPIYGVEVDPDTFKPLNEPQVLIDGDPYAIGYERVGENNTLLPAGEGEIEAQYQAFVAQQGVQEEEIPAQLRPMIRGMFSRRPYIEGAWMDKWNGRYYLQYAAPGTEYNTYADGVYISTHPLGPFTLAESNPFSYKPGGFFPGAGHGSTFTDNAGKLWHTATMRISKNHIFERRVGLWPAGVDKDGELFCNQRYGDWPLTVSGDDPWRDPPFMLLSAGKAATASSFTPGHPPENATEENVQTWWRAKTADREEWLQIDLGAVYPINAVQINFADDKLAIPCPGELRSGTQERFIDPEVYPTQWTLSGSKDGTDWFIIEDKSEALTDLPHDFLVYEQGIKARYLRLNSMAVPYGQPPCVSGLRVFGRGMGAAPSKAAFTAARVGDGDMDVCITQVSGALGYNILFGACKDKLYHSAMVFSAGTHRIGALIRGRSYVVRVDCFNENGITQGDCISL